MLLFCLVVMATLGRQGCRSSLGSSLGVPAPLRGAVLLSVETWTRRESGEGGGHTDRTGLSQEGGAALGARFTSS